MIFIVNDNELHRKLQADLVEARLNQNWRMFEDGADLLSWYEAQLELPEEERRFPACILLNNFMHRVHGPQALLRLRELERAHGLGRVPVVGISTMYSEKERAIFERHADAMLHVPFGVPEFLETVGRCVGKAHEAGD